MDVVENKPHVNIMSSPVGTFSGSKRVTRPPFKIKPEDLVIVSTVKGGGSYVLFFYLAYQRIICFNFYYFKTHFIYL